VYHHPPNGEQNSKLRVLVAEHDASLLKIAAWPVELITTRLSGPPTGFLMPKLEGFKDIHLLYGPKSRLTAFPTANYRFLVHAATNLARTFAVAHTHGAVVGDVNHANVVVSQQAMVMLIDCDSFQVCDRTTGEIYVCHVGGPHTNRPSCRPAVLSMGSFGRRTTTPLASLS
jgi:DNA-binding helix-hairpin-helix protein with protein kinase domain